MSMQGIGMMSGSSLDGLDIALCEIDHTPAGSTFRILDAITVPYSDEWRDALADAHTLTGQALMELDARYGSFIGQQVREWLAQQNTQADYIASHGHTVFHAPAEGYSTQIGSGANIAFEAGMDTVTTFRQADIAAGGQGAPFAPAIDRTLFPGYDGYLNLGGIANVHIKSSAGDWKAWDMGPCNQALNFLAAREGLDFDRNGQLAARGQVIPKLLENLLANYPATNGRPRAISNGEVRTSWITTLQVYASQPTEDLLHTTGVAISQMITNHLEPVIATPARILATGGGAHNTWLMDYLNALCAKKGIHFELPDKVIIDYKESLLMAWLGYCTIKGIPYSIHHITGATHNAIGGAIFRANR